MNRIIVLDSGPLGMISNPNVTSANQQARAWMEGQLEKNVIVALPEIADYEVRRELIRGDKIAGIKELDLLVDILEFIPFTREATLLAARLWADARRRGLPTGEEAALDGDVIQAAQAILATDVLGVGLNWDMVVATFNVGHLSRFVPAKRWMDII